MSEEFVKILRKLCGDENVFNNEMELASYSYDASFIRGKPKAVVRPSSADDVAEVVSAAAEHGVPLTPRGAGTSIVGGPVPIRGGVVLDMLRMNEIVEIDEENMQAIVEAGVRVRDLNSRLDGMFFPVDPDGLGVSTIAGLIAEDAASPLSPIYGTARDNVFSVEMVLGSGKIVRLSGNMLNLAVGSEGTLGVITRAVVRLSPVPESTSSFSIRMIDASDGLDLLALIYSRGYRPAVFEIIHRDVLDILEVDPEVGAIVEVAFVGPQPWVSVQSEALRDSVEEVKPLGMEEAGELPKSSISWLTEALKKAERSAVFVSVSASRSSIRDVLQEIDRVAMRMRLKTITAVNAPLGWIISGILFDPLDEREYQRAIKASEQVIHATLRISPSARLGFGTGIGASMAQAFEASFPEEAAVFRALKSALDPEGVMNPGKIVP